MGIGAQCRSSIRIALLPILRPRNLGSTTKCSTYINSGNCHVVIMPTIWPLRYMPHSVNLPPQRASIISQLRCSAGGNASRYISFAAASSDSDSIGDIDILSSSNMVISYSFFSFADLVSFSAHSINNFPNLQVASSPTTFARNSG